MSKIMIFLIAIFFILLGVMFYSCNKVIKDVNNIGLKHIVEQAWEGKGEK